MKRRLFNYWIKVYLYNNELILKITRGNGKYIGLSLLSLLLPYFLLKYAISKIYELIYGYKHINILNKKEENKTFNYKLAMVSIAKNEGPYIKEWIEYHKLIGFDKFYFYDNESNDNTQDVLRKYIEDGLVTYIYIKGKAQQLSAYNEAIKYYKDECKYMAFMDLDEYLVPTKVNEPIEKIIDQLIKDYPGASGVGVNWAIFGSSGHKKRPQGLITENYIYRSKKNHWANYHIKTICNPRRVRVFISPHYPLYKLGAFSVTDSGEGTRQYGWFNRKVEYKNLRINHYYSKSEEDYVRKISRGLGDREGNYDLTQFEKYNLNDIFDDSMSIYWSRLKKALYE